MVPDTPPTAEGDLAQTPFAHLLVYALDRRLTGELFISETPDLVHALRFERGAAVKIRMGDEFARLGELLVEEGLVTKDVIEGAVLTGGLLGDVLVLAGYVESEPLDRVLLSQFERRMMRFFQLPASATYRYFDQADTLKDWGGDPIKADPMRILWQGIREYGACSALFESTMERVLDVDLVLHQKCNLERFDLEDDARMVAEVISIEPVKLDGLYDLEGAGPDLVQKLVYAMVITRQLDLGRGALPLGVEERSMSLAKVQLRSQVHRAGAAVDAPGDGERSVRTLSVRGRAVIPRDDDAPASGPSSSQPEPERSGSSPAIDPATSPTPDAAASKVDVPPPPPPRPPADTEVEVGEAELDEVPEAEGTAAGSAAAREAELGDDLAGESTRRLVADTVRALPATALIKLAREKIDEKEPTMALEVCEIGLTKVSAELEGDPASKAELIALRCWASSLEPHPDLKALTLDLDDVIRARDSSVTPRFVRGLLRKRLGDSPGAQSDFRRVLEIEPDHAAALKELPSSADAAKRGETGFLKRLFRR